MPGPSPRPWYPLAFLRGPVLLVPSPTFYKAPSRPSCGADSSGREGSDPFGRGTVTGGLKDEPLNMILSAGPELFRFTPPGRSMTAQLYIAPRVLYKGEVPGHRQHRGGAGAGGDCMRCPSRAGHVPSPSSRVSTRWTRHSTQDAQQDQPLRQIQPTAAAQAAASRSQRALPQRRPVLRPHPPRGPGAGRPLYPGSESRPGHHPPLR